MPRIFADQNRDLHDPVRFETDGYSMPVGVEVLGWLETLPDCEIADRSWRSPTFGNLVERGVDVTLGTIRFRITCSCEHLLVARVAGSSRRFYEICAAIRDRDYEVAPDG